MLCHLLTKLELTASASMAQRLTDDCVSQWVNDDARSKSRQNSTFCLQNTFGVMPTEK